MIVLSRSTIVGADDHIVVKNGILCNWKIWPGIKVGGLAVCLSTAKLIFFRMHVHMVIPYHTTKFKSAQQLIALNTSFGAKLPI